MFHDCATVYTFYTGKLYDNSAEIKALSSTKHSVIANYEQYSNNCG